ncbi:MAG: 6,7-dimethyl-8-ribityllumazine synthase [Deltaproteobacteria bacterium]|nr:6,7-dimethyl-8-ribityllumazine synthase [Deltaproteobacteria bacterium]
MGQKDSSLLSLDAQGLKLAIVVSRYNPQVCEGLLQAALQTLEECGLKKEEVDIKHVPGAFEIPLAAQWLVETHNYHGVICLGAVIRGGTPHFDYVCEAVTHGLNQVMLKTSTPIGFGILTTNNDEEAIERSSDNENNKGRETARTVVEMALLKRELQSL